AASTRTTARTASSSSRTGSRCSKAFGAPPRPEPAAGARARRAPRATRPGPRGDPGRSSRPVRSAGGRREELQRDAVRVTEADAGAVVRVLDAAVVDAQLVEPVRPLLELGAVRRSERHVVETHAVLAELLGRCGR